MGINEKEKIAFVTGAKTDGGAKLSEELFPWGLWGREWISRTYEYYVLFTRSSGTAPLTQKELDSLLSTPAAIGFGDGPDDVVIRGVLEWVEQTDTGTKGYSYVAKLVPTIALLGKTRTSRVFLGKTAVRVVSEVLEAYQLASKNHFFIEPAPRETREYVVQYEESDLDFMQRWLEREGLFYWFQDGKKHEVLVIDEHNAKVPETRPDVVYSTHDPRPPHSMWDWHARTARTAARATVYDYTDRAPQSLVRKSADTAQDFALGTVFTFGEHLVDAAHADRIAKRRAERISCEERTFAGIYCGANLRAGYAFHFAGHPTDTGDYLITSLERWAGQRFYVKEDELEGRARIFPGSSTPYEWGAADTMPAIGCRIEAIPRDVPYRPKRKTPWPRIDGVLTGHIEADTDGKYAQLDSEGRYRVKMPFDLAGTTGSRASHLVRLAEPYAGREYGTHFPLHRGTEVLLAHVCGDPDRPVIVGAVPNPRTKSPVVDANATQSVIRTASGIHIEMEDMQG